MENTDIVYLKRHYGERFARLCRELFPTILEKPGLLSKIMSEKFDTVPTLYEDILPIKESFKNYIYSFVDIKNNDKYVANKSPEELFDETGYILYPECKKESDIQKFVKYFDTNEKLCTFRGGRLNDCRVWFAVKKNVDDIKRENFKNPQREDEYGTSVISIQFTKSKNSTLSIKNRYNHTVDNPDATFNNNLDKIALGLKDSFCTKYDINLVNRYNTEFMPEGYLLGSDGKSYKSNVEFWGVNYCANNIIVQASGDVIKYDKAKFVLIENYLIDLENKKITALDNESNSDSFVESIGNIKNIKVSLDQNKNKVIDITPEVGENIQIVANKSNQMIKYSDVNTINIGDGFLLKNRTIEEINLPNVKKIGKYFLPANENLEQINLPNVIEVGNCFLDGNEKIKKVNLPNLIKVGSDFLFSNENIIELNLPNAIVIESNFLSNNEKIEKINLPKVVTIGDYFLKDNKNITEIDLPTLKEVGNDFLRFNDKLKKVNLPHATKIGNYFLNYNKSLENMDLPNVLEIHDCFMFRNDKLEKVNLPNVRKIGNYFLSFNNRIIKINLPNATHIGDEFLCYNKKLDEIVLPNATIIGNKFLYNNKKLKTIDLPNIKKIGYESFFKNRHINVFDIVRGKQGKEVTF